MMVSVNIAIVLYAVTVIAVFIKPSCTLSPPSEDFTNVINFNSSGISINGSYSPVVDAARLYWKVENASILMELQWESNGFFFLTILPEVPPPQGPFDYQFFWVSNGIGTALDAHWKQQQGFPLPDIIQDYNVLSANETINGSSIKFSRPLRTCDNDDFVFLNDTFTVSGSYTAEDITDPHSPGALVINNYDFAHTLQNPLAKLNLENITSDLPCQVSTQPSIAIHSPFTPSEDFANVLEFSGMSPVNINGTMRHTIYIPNVVRLYWKVVGDNMIFELHWDSNGLILVIFRTALVQDFIFAWVSSGSGTIMDCHHKGAPGPSIKDAQQSYTVISACEAENISSIIFSRPLNTGDDDDVILLSNLTNENFDVGGCYSSEDFTLPIFDPGLVDLPSMTMQYKRTTDPQFIVQNIPSNVPCRPPAPTTAASSTIRATRLLLLAVFMGIHL